MKFTPQVRSKHPSHKHLKKSLNKQNFRSVIRLGSTTTTEECFPGKTQAQLNRVVEINKVQAIKNSANKLLMKQCFARENIKTADWWISNRGLEFLSKVTNTNTHIGDLPYPIIAKHIYGSRGTGNYKFDSHEQLEQWMRGKDLSNYIFEKFYNYNREYRLHVTKEGCFYTCRKVLRENTPENQRWFRNDSNSNWLVEENPSFDKPVNWNNIVQECIKALNAVGLDIGGFDVKVQSANDKRGNRRENPEFIIIESNSACSHGEVTAIKYKQELNKMLNNIRI